MRRSVQSGGGAGRSGPVSLKVALPAPLLPDSVTKSSIWAKRAGPRVELWPIGDGRPLLRDLRRALQVAQRGIGGRRFERGWRRFEFWQQREAFHQLHLRRQ